MQLIDCRINLIDTAGRHRKDFGDIEGLAGSIDEIGLLQPIGIDSKYKLVFGERRLKAFQHLGLDTIPARFVNLDSLLKGEYAENEFRKDFTVSERVEIGRALEVELGERRGRPSNDGNISTFSEDQPEGATRDIAAKSAGFGNGKTYEQAKRVIDTAPPEVVEAMDAGNVSVNLAAQVAELPEPERETVAQAIREAPETAKTVAREAVKAHVANNSGNNEWYTPAEYIEAARRVMGGIDVDPASSAIANARVQASTYFTAEDDGLKQEWHGRVWMNPPYAQPLIAHFSDAVAEKYASGEIEQACVLVNNATDTGWFHRLASEASAICFPRGRIRFIDPDGKPSGAPLQGQAVLYMGDCPAVFAAEFSEFGFVVATDARDAEVAKAA